MGFTILFYLPLVRCLVCRAMVKMRRKSAQAKSISTVRHYER